MEEINEIIRRLDEMRLAWRLEKEQDKARIHTVNEEEESQLNDVGRGRDQSKLEKMEKEQKQRMKSKGEKRTKKSKNRRKKKMKPKKIKRRRKKSKNRNKICKEERKISEKLSVQRKVSKKFGRKRKRRRQQMLLEIKINGKRRRKGRIQVEDGFKRNGHIQIMKENRWRRKKIIRKRRKYFFWASPMLKVVVRGKQREIGKRRIGRTEFLPTATGDGGNDVHTTTVREEEKKGRCSQDVGTGFFTMLTGEVGAYWKKRKTVATGGLGLLFVPGGCNKKQGKKKAIQLGLVSRDGLRVESQQKKAHCTILLIKRNRLMGGLLQQRDDQDFIGLYLNLKRAQWKLQDWGWASSFLVVKCKPKPNKASLCTSCRRRKLSPPITGNRRRLIKKKKICSFFYF